MPCLAYLRAHLEAVGALLHGGEDPLLSEDLSDIYSAYSSFDPFNMNTDDLVLEDMGTTPLFLAAAAN